VRRSGLVLVAALLLIVGCTRNWYRQAADNEVNDILAEKDQYPAWKIESYHVYADPRARFASPCSPDRPPMPPDDQAAWQMSPHPQCPGCCNPGVGNVESTTYLEIMKLWDADNRTARAAARKDADTPATGSGAIQASSDEPLAQPGLLLNLEQAVELGLINSREYQSIREDLYLEALPVTLQRFSFAWQFAAVEDAFRQWAGVNANGGYQNNWTLGSKVSAAKLFSTGALLTASLANTTVFNFARDKVSSASLINVDFAQPLLQGGGKTVALEPLTQAERNLVYSIRAYGHFRSQFFTSITLGSNLPQNLAVAAGATTGGSSPISTLAALGIAATDVSGQFRGYLPTLFRQLDLAVDQKYVRDLEKAVVIIQGYADGGQLPPLNADQVRSDLLNARNTVLKDQQDLSNAVDQFKLQLGVPANLPLVLDDAPARPITSQLDRFYEVQAEAEAAGRLVHDQDQLPPEKYRAFLVQVFTTTPLVRGTQFLTTMPAEWDTWKNLKTPADVKTRLDNLDKEHKKLEAEKLTLEAQTPPDQKALEAVQARMSEIEFQVGVGSLEQALRTYESRRWEKVKDKSDQVKLRLHDFRQAADAAELVLIGPRNERLAEVGRSWPELPATVIDGVDLLAVDTDEAQEHVARIALAGRWDLMNARAQVVDAWRLLAVTANALLGVLNVQYHLDSTTPPGGNRPLAFSAAATNQELIINAQLPLVRVAERNAYRAAIINYERARRALMALEDALAAQVRFDVRQLNLFAQNFKIQERLLALDYSLVENTLLQITAPLAPGGSLDPAAAAALVNQYRSALSTLNGAQTNMYRVWLSFLATRMQLYLDLERLPLDTRGVWIDESGKSALIPAAPAGGATGRSGGPGYQRDDEQPPRPRLLPPA
jgi:hypothetical protein